MKIKLCKEIFINVPRCNENLSTSLWKQSMDNYTYPHLEELVLSDLNFMYALPFIRKTNQSPSLKKLRIIRCNKLKTHDIFSIKQVIYQLKELELRELTKITSKFPYGYDAQVI